MNAPATSMPTASARSTGYLLTEIFANVDDDAGLERRWAPFFLIIHKSRISRLDPMRTRTADSLSETTRDLQIWAHPVLRRPDSNHNFISVGRVEGNDISLFDETVSKFHAYIKLEGRQCLLQDARSRNGTTVDRERIPARGEGFAVALRSGAEVRFGSVLSTFVDANALWRLAQVDARRS